MLVLFIVSKIIISWNKLRHRYRCFRFIQISIVCYNYCGLFDLNVSPVFCPKTSWNNMSFFRLSHQFLVSFSVDWAQMPNYCSAYLPGNLRDDLPTRSSLCEKIASLAGRSKRSPAESLVLLSFQIQQWDCTLAELHELATNHQCRIH